MVATFVSLPPAVLVSLMVAVSAFFGSVVGATVMVVCNRVDGKLADD